MIRHLLKLVWNRKGANALIIVEIFFSFLVVFVVATLGLHLWRNLQDAARLRLPGRVGGERSKCRPRRGDRSRDDGDLRAPAGGEPRRCPPVMAAAGGMTAPYGREGWIQRAGRSAARADRWQHGGGDPRLRPGASASSAAGGAVSSRRRIAALAWKPVVINRAAGPKRFTAMRTRSGNVSRDPRPDSKAPENAGGGGGGGVPQGRRAGARPAISPSPWSTRRTKAAPRKLALQLRPGTPASFEEELARRLQAVAPDWSFEIRPLRQHAVGHLPRAAHAAAAGRHR